VPLIFGVLVVRMCTISREGRQDRSLLNNSRTHDHIDKGHLHGDEVSRLLFRTYNFPRVYCIQRKTVTESRSLFHMRRSALPHRLVMLFYYSFAVVFEVCGVGA